MHYLFQIEFSQVEKCEELLTNLGFEHLYTLEEDGMIQMGGYHTEDLEVDLPLIKKEASPQIDWEQEWQLHAPNYQDGQLKQALSNGAELILTAGPGFGDLSHPTTQLCLEALAKEVPGATVFDLGSGSGVLSLAAAYLGAKQVYGIEIDPAAIDHANLNLSLNDLNNVTFLDHMPPIPEGPIVCVMNMTLEEQKILLSSYPELEQLEASWIISGLLEGQADPIAQSGEWILSTSSPAFLAFRPCPPSQASHHP